MRNVSLNTKKYKLPSGINVPTTTPFPSRKIKKNTPGSKFYTSSYFARIPDQSPKEKALLAVPESKVQQNIVTDYTKQSKAVEKTRQHGLKLDQDLIFETLKKLKTKGKKGKKQPAKKPKKSSESKKIKKASTPNFALSS